MTDLEKAVCESLRLTEKSGEKLLSQIQRCIKTARAEMIRVGVNTDVANSNHVLVEDAIITLCLLKMDEEKMQDKHQESWEVQLQNLRKSNIRLEAGEDAE
ncbi:MAG: hypothetical protein MJZ37_08050 [Bacilli bacterium]|nr:hypothetical protein [Bacilli bacterium]